METKKPKEQISHNIDNSHPLVTIELLNNLTNKLTVLAQHLDIKINILIGLSTASFVFFVSHLQNIFNSPENIPFLIGTIFSAISSLTALFAIHPPLFMRKEGQYESIFYNNKIASYSNALELEKDINIVIKSQKNIVHEYSIEAYNLAKYYYKPKRKLFYLSRTLFMLGIVISLFSFIIF